MKTTTKVALKIIAISTALLFSSAHAAEPKMQQLHDKAGAAPALKDLDKDNKKLSEEFKQLLIKQGYAPSALENCHTECTVSCTWVNGQCQPTTSCTLKCDM